MKRLGVFLLTYIVLSSCYMPPYREELSLALPATKQMEGVAVVGPLDRRPWDFQGREIVFYPSKDALRLQTNEFIRGFIVATDDRSVRLMFVDHGLTVDDDYYIGSDNPFPLENPDDTQFTHAVSPVKDGVDTDGELLGIVIAGPGSDWREFLLLDQFFQIVTASVPIDMNIGIAGDLALPPPPDTLVIGASFLLDNTIDSDLFCGLAFIDSTGEFAEAIYRTDSSTGLAFAGSIRTIPSFDLPGLPEDLRNVFYFHNIYSANSTSYVSYYDRVRRGYRNFSWDNALQLRVLVDMDRRIDLVLSNDWLFSKDGNKGYVYNGDGEILNSFVMGGLSLVYEMYDGVRNRAVFTIPVWAPVSTGDRNWEDKLFFLVYWIPTEQLADL